MIFIPLIAKNNKLYNILHIYHNLLFDKNKKVYSTKRYFKFLPYKYNFHNVFSVKDYLSQCLGTSKVGNDRIPIFYIFTLFLDILKF